MATKKAAKLRAAGRSKRGAGQLLPLDREPSGRLDLVFDNPHVQHATGDKIYENVSALAVDRETIFCSCDEKATIERVIFDPATGTTRDHDSFAFSHLFHLPDGPDGEIDIEALSIADGFLWICGSHAFKRAKVKAGLQDLAEIKWDANRGFLGRIPLVDLERLMTEPEDRLAAIVPGSIPGAAMLKMKSSPRTELRKLLAEDPIIGPYLDLPSKENGFDIEGLAVAGETVLLGLRGPVIGGYAIVVRLRVKETEGGVLKLAKLDTGARYALQAIDLNGQGIRELSWRGGRLAVMSGATTKLESLQSVFAIDAYDPAREVYEGDAITRLLDFPAVRGADHAEGMAFLNDGKTERLLVVYDSPHSDRLDRKTHCLTADLFDFA